MIFKAVQVENYCKRPDLNIKAVLVYGSNSGLVAEYMQKFIQTVSSDLQDPFAVTNLDWDEIKSDYGVLIGEYNAQSLMAGRRAVVLKNGTDDLTKVLKSFLEDSKSDSLLVIAGSENLNSHGSLVNYFNDEKFLVSVPCYDDRGKDLASSVQQILAKHNLTYKQDAFDLLCSMMSNDRKFNLNEIEKLVTYVGSRRYFEASDVRKVIFDASGEMEDLGFYTFSGLKIQALKIVNNLLDEGVEAVKIVRSLSRHVNILLEAKSLVEGGISSENAVKKVLSRRLFYRYGMAKAQVDGWSKERLFDVMNLLYTAEKDCKTTNYPTSDVLNYLLLKLVAAASKVVKPVLIN